MQIIGIQNNNLGPLAAELADCDVKLRWGGVRCGAGAINGDVRLLNGLQQMQAMQAAGVRTPVFTTNLREAEAWSAEGVVVLGRKVHHTQGKDIVLPSNSLWRLRDFWVQYCGDVRSEWRLHILKGKCIGRGMKVPSESEPPRPTPVVVRSRRLGWRISHTQSPPEGMRDLARAAVRACQYDLGAVDCLELEGGGMVVLEVNSRPAIRDNYTIGQYAKYLRMEAQNAQSA